MIGKKSKLDLTIPQIIQNNIYAIKIMLKIYPVKFGFQMFFWISANFLNFFSHTYLLRYVVNGIQEGKSIRAILAYVIFVLVINIVINTLRAVYDNIVLPIIDQKCERRLNLEIYRRSLEIDLENYESPEAYDLYDRAISNGAGAIQDVIGMIGSAMAILISVSLDVWILFEIDPVLFVFVIIPWLFSPLQILETKKLYENMVETQKIDRRKDYTRRTFFQVEFAKEMRLTNIYTVMQRRFHESIKEYLHLVRTKGFQVAAIGEIRSLGTTILSTRASQIYAVYHTLVSGTMMYGDCLVVMNTIGGLSSTAEAITLTFANIYDIALNIRDYRNFMDMTPKVSPNYNGLEPNVGDIECKNLTFRYKGADRDSLKNVNLKIKQGERVAIVGYNGAGKTTLVKLLMRLYDPCEGEICVNEKDIREYKLKEYRSTYGVVFQDYKLMAFTVAENVLGRPYQPTDEKTVWDALEKADIAKEIAKLPQGIHTVLTKEFEEDGLVLSGGQSQKLAIASLYARNVQTVILDEPSSALDPLAEHRMYQNMINASAGKTVIFISHRLSSCVDADRVFYMENGTVTESGSHRELMQFGGKYAEMFRMQAQNYTDVVYEGGEVRA